MTINTIDINVHGTSFPTGYAGHGNLIGNPVVSPPGMSRISGYFTGAGNDVVIPLGTQATHVLIVDATGNIAWEWFRGMPATDVLKGVAAGTRTLDTGSGISVVNDVANSSTITIAAAVATNNSLLIYSIDC